MNKVQVVVPNLGVNESEGKLVNLYVKANEEIKKGQLLAEIETTKTVIEITSEYNGTFSTNAEIGSILYVGSTIGEIQTSDAVKKTTVETKKSAPIPEQSNDSTSITFTKKAEELIEKNNISKNVFSHLKIVKETDVQNYLNSNHQSQPATKPASAEYLGKYSDFNLSFTSNKIPIAIYGTSMGGEVYLEIIKLQNVFEPVCFIDDSVENIGQRFHGLPIVSGADLSKLKEKNIHHITIAVSDRKFRMNVMKKCDDLGLFTPNIIHPETFISPSVKMGKGNVIKAGTVIDAFTVIGNGCLIGNNVTLAHHTILGDGVHMAPNSSTGGATKIGDRCLVGINSLVSTKVEIGTDVVISPGVSICENLPNGVIVGPPKFEIIGKVKV